MRIGRLRAGIHGVEDIFSEEGKVNVLRKRTGAEFINAVKLSTNVVRAVGDKAFGRTPTARRPSCFVRSRDGCRRQLRVDASSRWDLAMPMDSRNDPMALVWIHGGWRTRQFHRNLQAKGWWKNLVGFCVILSVVHAALVPSISEMTSDEKIFYRVLEIFLFIFFVGEAISKLVAFRLFGGPDPEEWPCPSTCYELGLVVVQFLAAFGIEFAVGMQSFRTLRLIYLVERFKTIANGLAASISAAWTAILLLCACFFVYGIIGMNLFSGLLWHCEGADDDGPDDFGFFLSRNECEQAGKEWVNRPFHFDNILATWSTLFSVWTMAGWTTVWYWTM